MLRPSDPTASTLELVANDMTGIMEKLDTSELDLADGEYDTTDRTPPCLCLLSVYRHHLRKFLVSHLPVCSSSAARLPFTAIYDTLGFKEPEARVFLSLPITAKILEVERFTSAQDRFNITNQRSVNKVHTDKRHTLSYIYR